MRERVTVDSAAFAHDARELEGSLAVAQLHRVQDALHDTGGEVRYVLTGSEDREGVGHLALRLRGGLRLVCQRCLGPVGFEVDAVRRFELVAPGQDLGDPAEEPDDVERMHADAGLDVAALVEDEVLLVLPMVAMHEPGKCTAPASQNSRDAAGSPFEALAVLRRK